MHQAVDKILLAELLRVSLFLNLEVVRQQRLQQTFPIEFQILDSCTLAQGWMLWKKKKYARQIHCMNTSLD